MSERRRRKSPRVVALTGAFGFIGRRVVKRLEADPAVERIVTIDVRSPVTLADRAGIDFGLALMAEIGGEELAKTVQLGLEYAPQPPFNSGDPATADPATIALVREFFSAS